MYKIQFRSVKSFTKTTLKFRNNLINTLNIWSYINLSYILEITGKRFTGLLLDLPSFSLFLKTGITSTCFKQWGNWPVARIGWNFEILILKNVFIYYYKLYRHIAVRTSFSSIKSFDYIFHFVYWNRLETDRGNIFDLIMSLIFVILGWFWYLNDAFFTGSSMFSVFRM